MTVKLWNMGVRGEKVSPFTSPEEQNANLIKSELNMWHLCLRHDGHLNLLQAGENGFFSGLFMVKILYSFDYNKTSITLLSEWHWEVRLTERAQCNNDCVYFKWAKEKSGFLEILVSFVGVLRFADMLCEE